MNQTLDKLPTTIKPESTEETPLLTTPARKNDSSGYLFMLLSSIFFSQMATLVHVAEQSYSIPPATTIFFRGVIDTSMSATFILTNLNPRQVFAHLTPKERIILAMRGIFGSLVIVTIFTSLGHISMGESITLFFFHPILTLVFSHFVIGEPFTLYDMVAGVVASCGVGLIVYQPQAQAVVAPDAVRWVGLACAVAAAFLAAITFTIVRLLANKIHFMVSIFSLATCTLMWSILLGGALPISEFIRLKEGTMLAILAAVFACAGQCCLDKGLQHCRAGPGTLVRYVDVPLSYVLGLLFMHETPTVRSALGSVLVLAAALFVGIRQIAQG